MTRPGAEEARAAFERRLGRGEWRELIDARLRVVMEQAGAEIGLGDELGAARVVLARLLTEEEDLGKLALGVSRIVSASARVARAQKAIAPGPRDEITAAINQILDELDAQREAEERLQREGMLAAGEEGV